MSGERYFLENWVRGAKGDLFNESYTDPDSSHPHITFIRPFTVPSGNEEGVKKKIISFCRGKSPMSFVLEGKRRFSNGINYIPVQSDELLEFDSGLEESISKLVVFDKKLSDKKVLHLAITNEAFSGFPKTILPMLRLTCIRDKKIWFSYDFILKHVLDREQSLDKDDWKITKAIFNHVTHQPEPDLIQEVSQAISNFDPRDTSFDFMNTAIDFGHHGLVAHCNNKDTSFFEELAPNVFYCMDQWLRLYTDRSAREKDKNRYDNLSANFLLDTCKIACLSGDKNTMTKFRELVNYINVCQSDYGKALTDYFIAEVTKKF